VCNLPSTELDSSIVAHGLWVRSLSENATHVKSTSYERHSIIKRNFVRA
jgi:hypothetical protein